MNRKDFDLFPVPKEVRFTERTIFFPEKPVFRLVFEPGLSETAGVIRTDLEKLIPNLRFTEKTQADFHLILKTDFASDVPESYQLTVLENTAVFNGRDAAGVLYAFSTFRQLIRKEAHYTGSVPEIGIVDWPDIRYRACSRWLTDLEGNRMACDTGEGREAFLERCRRKLDFAFHAKINTVFFEGFHWNTEKYPGYAEDMRSLRKYASLRNVRLEFGGHIIGVGGRYPEIKATIGCGFQKGLGDLNRHRYPDGEPYMCMGKSADHPTRFNGACRSNDALNRLKRDQLAEYLRKVEPGMLYLHPEDVDRYELASDWRFRCDDCRKKWPSDKVISRRGVDGAQNYALRFLAEGVASVRTEDGYDGQKDVLFCIVPAGYAANDMSDEEWADMLKHYRIIAENLPEEPKVLMLIREEFSTRKDPEKFRTAEMAEYLKKHAKCGTAVFALNGADSFTNGRFFSPGALYNGYYAGAEMIFNFSGVIHQEVQELFNSECCWNLPPVTAAIQREMARLRQKYGEIPVRKLRHVAGVSKRNAAPDGMLARMCRAVYGKKAGNGMLKFFAMGNGQSYPFASLNFRMDMEHLFQFNSRELTNRVSPGILRRRWEKYAVLNRKAAELVSGFRTAPEDPFFRKDLELLARKLRFTTLFAEIVSHIFRPSCPDETLYGEIASAERIFRKEFSHDFLTEDEGEHQIWGSYLERLKEAVRKRGQFGKR